MDKVEQFKEFLETREESNGLTLYEGHVVVPKETLETLPADEVFSFTDLVTYKEVKSLQGVQPVLNDTDETMDKVKELLKSPPLPIKPFSFVEYEVETYRGFIKVPNEFMDDAAITDQDLQLSVNNVITNTRNKTIVDLLNTITEDTASDAEELKALLEELNRPTHANFYVSQEAYNKLHDWGLIKQSTEGETVLGKKLIPIEAKGNILFVGNLKHLAFLDRAINTVKFNAYQHYGTCLNVASRHDAKLIEGYDIKNVKIG